MLNMNKVPIHKITMLGASGSAKTTYVYALYGKMGGSGVHGFNLACENDDDAMDMLEGYRNMRRGKVPEKNAIGDYFSYQFTLTYGLKPRIGFDWFDYRGEALGSRSTDPDRQELKKRLLESDCVIICVDGAHLHESLSDPVLYEDVAEKIELHAVNKMLTEVHVEKRLSSENIFPVVLLITKWDLCKHRGQAEIMEDVKRLFPNFFMPYGNGWYVMVCPFTMGRSFENTNSDIPIRADERTHWPIMFALRTVLERSKNLAKQMSDNAESALSDISNKPQPGLFGRIMGHRGPSKEEIEMARRRVLEALASLNEMLSDFALIDAEINGKTKHIYRNGVQQE